MCPCFSRWASTYRRSHRGSFSNRSKPAPVTAPDEVVDNITEHGMSGHLAHEIRDGGRAGAYS